MSNVKPKKKLYEYALNVARVDNLPTNKIKLVTTCTNCMVMFSILICILMHFVGIDKNIFYGHILFAVILGIFLIMCGLGITLIVLDYKENIFKHRWIAPLFVAAFLLLTVFIFLSASKRCVYTYDEKGTHFHMDLIIFFSVFLPCLIVFTTLSCLFFINYFSMIRKRKRDIHAENLKNKDLDK